MDEAGWGERERQTAAAAPSKLAHIGKQSDKTGDAAS